MGQKKIGGISGVAVLTSIFLQENVWRFLTRRPKKVAVITRGGRKAGFHCTTLVSVLIGVKNWLSHLLVGKNGFIRSIVSLGMFKAMQVIFLFPQKFISFKTS